MERKNPNKLSDEEAKKILEELQKKSNAKLVTLDKSNKPAGIITLDKSNKPGGISPLKKGGKVSKGKSKSKPRGVGCATRGYGKAMKGGK